MTAFDRMLLAEKVAAVERHLVRVESRLPERAGRKAPIVTCAIRRGGQSHR